ncbi:Transcription factor DIVARICATA [Arachis hypogaea]|nr:Transcription factor DIVARICATA [Arachis hypogaea]
MALKTCFTLLHHSQHSSSRTFFSFPSFNSATCILHNESHNNHILHFSTFFTKRKLHLTLLLTTLPEPTVRVANLGYFGSPEFGNPADKHLQTERRKETKKEEEGEEEEKIKKEEEEIGNQERRRRKRRRRMSDEQSDSAMMNPWDIGDPCDMIDFDADDEAPQFEFECPPLPEPVWNGDENKIVAANVGEPCAMDVSGNQPHQPVIDECLSEAMRMTEHYWENPLSGYQPFQCQPQSRAIDVCGNQPLQSHPHPQPWSQPQLQPWSPPRPQSQTDIVRTLTDEFFADTCGYPPSQPQTEWDTSRNTFELIPNVGGHPQPQPQPPVWTWEENKAFESIITSCFQDTIQNCWEAVAVRLPGRTRAQLQERFQKLMKDINAVHKGYPTSTPLNATPPPPSQPYSTDHHHREEVVPAAEEEVVPTAQEEAAPTNTGYHHWTEDEHRNCALIQAF